MCHNLPILEIPPEPIETQQFTQTFESPLTNGNLIITLPIDFKLLFYNLGIWDSPPNGGDGESFPRGEGLETLSHGGNHGEEEGNADRKDPRKDRDSHENFGGEWGTLGED